MSSSMWSVASIKKSILFDVLSVMDRANRVKTDKARSFEYSLLRAETVKKYDTVYKLAKNQSDLMTAAFYVFKNKIHGDFETVIYAYLVDKALNMVSFKEMISFLESSTVEEIGYYIAAICLSTKEKSVGKREVGEIVKQGDMKLIEILNETKLTEIVKMSVYLIIFNYSVFRLNLINYMKKIYNYICQLYLEYSYVYKYTKKILVNFMKINTEKAFIMQETKKRVNDEKKRKIVIILSIIRLEHSWVKHTNCTLYHNKGIFALQRIMHSNDFTVF